MILLVAAYLAVVAKILFVFRATDEAAAAQEALPDNLPSYAEA
jgi:hypothetical protein